ncbi:hypothetical protein RRF57_008951 [Xylaria bambusicola]|uniref:Uncharacterized protein n=1 Tax=Xylaria bambusicola TaxID=326684 RepID=A0AAN7UQ64_9PEZI
MDEGQLKNLITVVERLENGFATKFANWKGLGLPSAAHYFQQSYAETISILHSITGESQKDVAPQLKLDLKALFKRTVALLPMSVGYARSVGVRLRPVHKDLLSNVQHLCERPDIRGTNGLAIHVIQMYKQLDDIWPPAREAWEKGGTDLKPDTEFDLAYEQFCGLDNQRRRMQGDYERYARNSWRLLLKACQALHLPEGRVHPGDDFFNNDTRPTYVEYACDSEEFVYGKGKRPGILGIKAILGATLTADQQKRLKNAANASTNAKSSPQTSSEVSTGLEYSMTRINAIADLQDVLRDSEALGSRDQHIMRPDEKELVTPTWENRKETLMMYKNELKALVDEIYKDELKMPFGETMLPTTPNERGDWLRLAEEKIKQARVIIDRTMRFDSSAWKAKKLRLTAYSLKLTRAIYMVRLFSGTPAASRQEIKDALIERLNDWILYEQAWNAADVHIKLHVAVDQETKDKLQRDIEGREANIARLTDMRDYVTGDDSGISLGYDNSNNPLNVQHKSKESDTILTDDTIRTAKILLNNILNPSLPNASDYLLDVREERRRRGWYQKMAQARLTGGPTPEWTHKKVIDPFTAGGPPEWESLPRQSRWERLQYMWVMTYWRFYQLRELQL